MTRISEKQITWIEKLFKKDETKRKRLVKSLKICHILFHENEINDIEVAKASIISDDNVLAIFNSKLSKYDGFTINSINANDIIKKYEEFILHKIYTKIGNFDNYDISDKEIEIAMKNALDIKDGMVATDILSKSDSVVSAIVDIIKSHQIRSITTESTDNIVDAEIVDKVPSDEEINNSVDINKELDEEAQEEIIDAEEIPDEEVMNDAEIKEEKNEETIAEDQEEAQEEKKEETIVSSSSEAAERFITDEDLLEKVGDKFFEEAKDKISKIAKNKSLAKKQKKNRINRIVKSYSSKVKDSDDPIKETEEKERIIASVVEDIKKPETIEEKNKDIIDSFPYPETKGNSFIKKILRDNIKNIILSRVDEDIYKIEMPRKNGFTDMCYISFGKKSFEIGIRRQMTQGAIIIVPMPSNPALGNISNLNEQVFREVIEVGTMGITQYSDSFISIPFNVKKRAS